MSLRNQKVLVLWPKEDKAGVEPLSNVPETSRFVGAVTPVMFSGNKKWYPGKILMISDDNAALELKANQVAEEISARKAAEAAKLPASKKRRQSNAKRSANSSAASEQDIARALGKKVPVPAEHQEAQKAAKKAKSDAIVNHALGQNQLDGAVLSNIKRKLLFNQNRNGPDDNSKEGTVNKTAAASMASENYDIENNSMSEDSGNEPDSNSDNDEGGDQSRGQSHGHLWCGCSSCTLLQKYDNPTYHQFLRDVLNHYDCMGEKLSNSPRYLTLLPVKDGVKMTELTIGTGVFLPLSLKDQLKVDFKNKPSILAKELLFALYGEETFRILPVTGRGNKEGTYGIEEYVLKSIVSFVNRHVDGSKAMKINKLVAYINKRAPEWRKMTPSPINSKFKNKKLHHSSKVMSTSPFKCSPLKFSPLRGSRSEQQDVVHNSESGPELTSSTPSKSAAITSLPHQSSTRPMTPRRGISVRQMHSGPPLGQGPGPMTPRRGHSVSQQMHSGPPSGQEFGPPRYGYENNHMHSGPPPGYGSDGYNSAVSTLANERSQTPAPNQMGSGPMEGTRVPYGYYPGHAGPSWHTWQGNEQWASGDYSQPQSNSSYVNL